MSGSVAQAQEPRREAVVTSETAMTSDRVRRSPTRSESPPGGAPRSGRSRSAAEAEEERGLERRREAIS